MNLNNLSVEELGKLFPVQISEYDPEWKALFLSEKEIIQDTLGSENIIRLEHIGSTSVPGLSAKPTIDILLEIKDETDIDQIITQLKQIGYDSIPQPENPLPHLDFAKGYSITGYIGQTYHIHIRYQGDWDEIIFRDYLIMNPQAALQYSRLKKKLSIKFRNNREKYTDSKTDFIKKTVKRARKGLRN